MNIDRWIKWREIWDKEICLESPNDAEVIEVINQFKRDKDIHLDEDECQFTDGELIFYFSESGGQNPSDTQGWSRGYTFVVDSDFSIIDAEYEQG